MKKLFTFIIVIASIWAYAQAPEAMKYQTIVRSDDGAPMPYKVMDFRISIIRGGATGQTVYVEYHYLATNGNGLASFKIGLGTVESGDFGNISWGSDSHYIKVEARENGQPSYLLMGIEELVSVPYALYSSVSAATDAHWQQDGSNIFYMDGNVGIKTDNPTEALTIGTDNRIQLSTVKNSLTYGAVINMRMKALDAKPGIHWQDEAGNSKVALSTYEYETYPNIQSKKFSIATTNQSDILTERFNIHYGLDVVDVNITNANLNLVDGNTFQVGSYDESGLANYYGDVFVYGNKKMGIGDKDWEQEGTFENAQLELYRAESDVELLLHSEGGAHEVGIHLRNGENDWNITHDGDFNIKHEGATFFKINSAGNVGIDIEEPIAKLDVNGNINVSSGFGYLVGGSGKAAYLPVVDELAPGDIAGMNPNTGEIGKFQNGDVFIGIVTKQAGFVENYSKDREKDSSFALISSKGQLEADLSQVIIQGRLVSTPDGQQIGILLKSGKIFIK